MLPLCCRDGQENGIQLELINFPVVTVPLIINCAMDIRAYVWGVLGTETQGPDIRTLSSHIFERLYQRLICVQLVRLFAAIFVHGQEEGFKKRTITADEANRCCVLNRRFNIRRQGSVYNEIRIVLHLGESNMTQQGKRRDCIFHVILADPSKCKFVQHILVRSQLTVFALDVDRSCDSRP
jgi:hypothetical protein